MKAYIIKVALRDVSPMVWRRFRLASDTSLAHLHFIIQIAHGWDDEYLHKFRIYGKDYGIYHEGGITFSDNPFHTTLDSLGLEVGDRFTYEYNFFESWLHDIRIEEIKENCSCLAISKSFPPSFSAMNFDRSGCILIPFVVRRPL
ncbi:plasmid pRiA4b ORF-3 family protein, partial [Vibrio mediterranei]|uniref:plasmid pRiA4b ORF-3 family protein n=1 Tax=Vibrio mediterranei TaxID=689 RepID=UPI00148E5617